jgi:ketosteroid isomerase-like protein
MNNRTPLELITTLLDARGRGDVEAAVACFEADATMVIEPDHIERGDAAIRRFTKSTFALPVTMLARRIVDGRDVALHVGKWRLDMASHGSEAQQIVGCTTDILRKQIDGSWLVAIHNPWGSAIGI